MGKLINRLAFVLLLLWLASFIAGLSQSAYNSGRGA